MAANILLKIAGVTGDSKIDGHEDEIDLLSASFGSTNPSSRAHGGGAGTAKVNVHDLMASKRVNAASPELFLKTCDGTHYEGATVFFLKAGGDGGTGRISQVRDDARVRQQLAAVRRRRPVRDGKHCPVLRGGESHLYRPGRHRSSNRAVRSRMGYRGEQEAVIRSRNSTSWSGRRWTQVAVLGKAAFFCAPRRPNVGNCTSRHVRSINARSPS